MLTKPFEGSVSSTATVLAALTASMLNFATLSVWSDW
jgi:hypothetical protein